MNPLSRDTLTSKLGPLPVWAWGLTAGGTIAGIRYLLGRRSAPAEPVTSEAIAAVGTDTEAIATGSDTLSGGAIGSGTGAGPGSSFYAADPSAWTPTSYTPTTTPDTPTSTSPTTNAEWRQQVTQGLIAKGVSALLLGQALDAYLAGGRLDYGKAQLVERITREYGPPPDAPPASEYESEPLPVTPTPAVPVAPAPAVPVAPAPAVPATPVPAPARTDTRRDAMDSNQINLVEAHMQDARNREGRTITFDQSAAELDRFFAGLK